MSAEPKIYDHDLTPHSAHYPSNLTKISHFKMHTLSAQGSHLGACPPLQDEDQRLMEGDQPWEDSLPQHVHASTPLVIAFRSILIVLG